ncbi:MAG: hypothetical protein M1823_003050 [Watsoniomyces obsoletus]|nr:MAG: hypothetical protein M1823_003050 [Watsoniomyces obsoletus]
MATQPANITVDAESPPSTIKPYSLHVSARYLDLTRRKLELTRLPHGPSPEAHDGSDGVAKEVIEPDIDYWLERYDWRRRECHFNERLPQYRTVIASPSPHPPLRLHFLHKRAVSSASDIVPLLYCHSWPGGIIEVIRIIDALTSLTDGRGPAFHLVAPSVPGCGFSEASDTHGLGTREVADIFDRLMLKLGYRHYIAHGTEWGFDICRMLAIHHSDRCLATHTTTPLPYLRPPSFAYRPLQYFKYLAARLMPRSTAAARLGYQPHDLRSVHRARRRVSGESRGAFSRLGLYARPRTLAYALCDSPVGLLAWTREALTARTRVEDCFSVEDALDFTMISWLPGPDAPLQYLATTSTDTAEMRDVSERWSAVPLGLTVFPDPQADCPPAWAACVQPLAWIRRHQGSDVGWPVWERPTEVVDDLKAFLGFMLQKDPRLRKSCTANLDDVD